jgi:hypothetical protein
MRPGDRVELLRKLAGRLAESDYPWEDMELVLGQFGFGMPDADRWEGNRRSFALASLQAGQDESLVGLDEYLFGGASRDVLDPADLPWETGAFRLFISHTSANAALAGEIRAYFTPWRIDAFVAHTTIEPTRKWEQVIEGALSSCHALTTLLTEDFVASKWCDQEVGYCLARHIPIVPVRLGVDPHGFIAKFQAARVDRRSTATWIADGVFRALARHAALRELMVAPVVYRFAQTKSFDGARANFPLLSAIPADSWTRDLVEVVTRALEENGQLREANLSAPPYQSVSTATHELLQPIRERLQMDLPIDMPPVQSDDDIPF